MKYIKAQDVLPQNILAIIQEYVDGEYLYIPRKTGEKKSWGEKSGTKNMINIRNQEIYQKYLTGISIPLLSDEYYLSDKSIRRIITNKKRECS